MSEDAIKLAQKLDALKKCLLLKEKQLQKWEKITSKKKKQIEENHFLRTDEITIRGEFDTATRDDVGNHWNANDAFLRDGKVSISKECIPEVGRNGNVSLDEMQRNNNRSMGCSGRSNEKRSFATNSSAYRFSHDAFAEDRRRSVRPKSTDQSQRFTRLSEQQALTNAMIASTFDLLIRETKKLSTVEFCLPRDDYNLELKESVQSAKFEVTTEDTMDLLLDRGDADEVVARVSDVRPTAEGSLHQSLKDEKPCWEDKFHNSQENAPRHSDENLCGVVNSSGKIYIKTESDNLQQRHGEVAGERNFLQDAPSEGSCIRKNAVESDRLVGGASTHELKNEENDKEQDARENSNSQFHFAECIGASQKSLGAQPVIKVDCGEKGTTITVRQRTKVKVWTEEKKGWKLSAEYRVSPQGGVVLDCCVLDNCVIVLVRRKLDDVLVRICPSSDETRNTTLRHRSDDAVPLVCRVRANHFAICTSRGDGTSVITVHGENGSPSAELETAGGGEITSVCGVRNQDGIILAFSRFGDLLIWNWGMGDLQRKLHLDKWNILACLTATIEAGVLFCLVKATDREYCHLLAIHPTSGTIHILRSYDLSNENDRLCVSSDGRYLSSASDDRGVRIWDILTGKVVARIGSSQGVSTVSVTPERLFVGYREGCTHVYRHHFKL